MKVLAFAATNSARSINKQLVTYAAKLLSSEDSRIESDILDIDDYEMPLFSIDREEKLGQPDKAIAFFNKIKNADAVIISFAEHNGSYTAAYKNLFDWTSRIDQKIFQGKQMILLSTSPGPGGAQSVLKAAIGSAPHFGADVKASLSVPSFYDNFDTEAGEISNEKINRDLKTALANLL